MALAAATISSPPETPRGEPPRGDSRPPHTHMASTHTCRHCAQQHRAAGSLPLPPPPLPQVTIERALANGVDVKMITGDHLLIARETARSLGMGTNICLPLVPI